MACQRTIDSAPVTRDIGVKTSLNGPEGICGGGRGTAKPTVGGSSGGSIILRSSISEDIPLKEVEQLERCDAVNNELDVHQGWTASYNIKKRERVACLTESRWGCSAGRFLTDLPGTSRVRSNHSYDSFGVIS